MRIDVLAIDAQAMDVCLRCFSHFKEQVDAMKSHGVLGIAFNVQ